MPDDNDEQIDIDTFVEELTAIGGEFARTKDDNVMRTREEWLTLFLSSLNQEGG